MDRPIGKAAGRAGAGRLRARFFARDERGAAAVVFAVALLLLVPATLGLVDVYMITTQRSQLQDALDTATLYVARSDKTSATDIQTIGDDALRANLRLGSDQRITYTSFKLDGIKIVSTAKITPPSIGPRMWTQSDIQANSEVLRNSNNVEVALVLDTTGSMSAQMGNLRSAAKELVDLVVKDVQTPYYTKVAIVPYSYGVNMGGYEAKARSAVRGATAITGATKTNPVMVTSVAHGLKEGERVRITGVKGMTDLNDKTFIAAEVTKDTFKLKRWDDGAGAAYWVNGNSYGKYTSGGTAQCRGEGCATHTFTNVNLDEQSLDKTACATERIGVDAYTDAGPSTAPVGWHYGSCPSASIMPLSSNKSALKSHIDSLDDAGSTAGHIGLAWGWYMISPAWSSVWTGASAPAAYDKPQLLKVVVLMTDGAFNTPYCKGVAAKDSGSGAPGASSRINCNATNGDPFAQAETLCRNIRDKGVIIYTVGFNVGSDADVKNLMENCATSPEYVYMPANGADLKIAFKAIAQDINSLRISK